MKNRTYRIDAREIEVTDGSENVFADLDLPDADGLLLKSKLAIALAKIIKERKLTQQRQ